MKYNPRVGQQDVFEKIGAIYFIYWLFVYLKYIIIRFIIK